jgi:hypothetical protein
MPDTYPYRSVSPSPIANGGVYTAVARDAVGGGAPLGLILMDDFTL